MLSISTDFTWDGIKGIAAIMAFVALVSFFAGVDKKMDEKTIATKSDRARIMSAMWEKQ